MKRGFPNYRSGVTTWLALLVLWIGALAPAFPVVAQNSYFDELYDESGKPRLHYERVESVYRKLTKEQQQKIRARTLKDFKGDNALSPLPKIIPESEFEQIRRGVSQRGMALLRFLQDHYSSKNYIRDGIIPEKVITEIVRRAGEGAYDGVVNPNLISFMYGPDIIKDAKGTYRVLEDNTNYLGGQGDLVLARKSLYKNVPPLADVLEKDSVYSPETFYKDLISRYRSEMANPNDLVVFYSVPPYPDQEDARLKKLWSDVGAIPTTPNSNSKLIKKSDGLYLWNKLESKDKAKRVGFVIFNSEFTEADISHPAIRKQWLIQEAKWQLSEEGVDALSPARTQILSKALDPDPKTGKIDYPKIEHILRENYPASAFRSKSPGLMEAILTGQVRTNNTPGTEFINDKEFNMYVEDLIRYYLKEEPVLRNLSARRVYTVDKNGKRIADPEVMNLLKEKMDEYVIKVVDGRGGDGVWVGPKLSPSERTRLLGWLSKETNREVIIQKYTHPSVLGGDIVDLRVLSQIGPTGIAGHAPTFVPNIGWSRGVSMNGDGKVNISAGTAHEVTVIVTKSGEYPKINCGAAYKYLQ